MYRTKIDTWLIVLIMGFFSWLLIEGLMEREWLALIILLPFGYVIYLMFAIKYVITGEFFQISAGFFLNTKIRISEISVIEKSNNLLSAPAMSLDRLEIKYGRKFESALISPRRREEFISELVKINPQINVKL